MVRKQELREVKNIFPVMTFASSQSPTEFIQKFIHEGTDTSTEFPATSATPGSPGDTESVSFIFGVEKSVTTVNVAFTAEIINTALASGVMLVDFAWAGFDLVYTVVKTETYYNTTASSTGLGYFSASTGPVDVKYLRIRYRLWNVGGGGTTSGSMKINQVKALQDEL